MLKNITIKIKPYMKMVDLIEGNPSFLLFMQHFEIDFRVDELTVAQICEKYDISEKLFITVGNLYYGQNEHNEISLSNKDILQLIQFLKNSHIYYRKYKYPELES